MLFSSPHFAPISASSNPGINCPLPMVRSKPSALPPSNAMPSTKPSKSIFTMWSFLTDLSLDSTSSPCDCAIISSRSWIAFFSGVGILGVGILDSRASRLKSGIMEIAISTSIASLPLSNFVIMGSPINCCGVSCSSLSALDSISCISSLCASFSKESL